jgi:integrase
MKVQSSYIRKRGKKLQGVLSWKDGKTWKQTTKMLKATTKTAAQRELLTWRAEKEREDEKKDSKIAVKYAESFIDGLEASRMVEPSTVLDYRHTMRMIRSMLGNLPLNKITTQGVQRGEAELLRSGLSPTTVGKAHRLLKEICFHAVEVGDLTTNPVSAVKPPKRPSATPNALDVRERERLVSTLDGMGESSLTIAIRLALYGGMRVGEVCGLRWDDVDLGTSRLLVRRSIGHSTHGTYIKEPKTGHIRDIPLGEALSSHLKAWRHEQQDDASRHGVMWSSKFYVVGSVYGGYNNPTILSRNWHALSSAMNLIGTEGKRCTFHDLRHTFATAAIAAGVDVKTVSSILGHANAAMTLNVYASADPDAKKRAAAVIDRAI